VLWLIGTTLFFSRRKLEPIRSRGWELISLANAIGWGHFVFLCAVLDTYDALGTHNCNLLVWEVFCFLPLYAFPYIMRGYYLFFQYQLNTELTKDSDKNWYLEHRRFVSVAYLFGFNTLGTVLLLLLSIFFQIFYYKPSPYDTVIICIYPQRIPLITTGLIITAIVGVCAYKIYHVQDSFNIKNELTAVAVMLPPFFITWWALEVAEVIPTLKYILLLVAVGLGFLLTILVPVFLTFRDIQVREEVKGQGKYDGLDSWEMLELCLNNDGLYKAFQQHCVETFCVENALFYRDVVKYEKGDLVKRKIESHNLKTLYLSETSRLMVNITGKNRQAILEAFQRDDYSDQVFKDAKREVLNQLYMDVFPKFRTSKGFEKAWKEAKVEKAASLKKGKNAGQYNELQESGTNVSTTSNLSGKGGDILMETA